MRRGERAVAWILMIGGVGVFSGLAIPALNGMAPWQVIHVLLTPTWNGLPMERFNEAILIIAPHLAGLALVVRQWIRLVRNEESVEVGVVALIVAGSGTVAMVMFALPDPGSNLPPLWIRLWTALPLGLCVSLIVYGVFRDDKKAVFDLVECQGIACILWWPGFVVWQFGGTGDPWSVHLWRSILLGVAVVLAGAAVAREVMRRPVSACSGAP